MGPIDISRWDDSMIEARLNSVLTLRRGQVLQAHTFVPRELNCLEAILWCLFGCFSASLRNSYFDSDKDQVRVLMTQLRVRVENNNHLLNLWEKANTHLNRRMYRVVGPGTGYSHPAAHAHAGAGHVHERAGSGHHHHHASAVPLTGVRAGISAFENAGSGQHHAAPIHRDAVAPSPRIRAGMSAFERPGAASPASARAVPHELGRDSPTATVRTVVPSATVAAGSGRRGPEFPQSPYNAAGRG